jgi:hypothetical protein
MSHPVTRADWEERKSQALELMESRRDIPRVLIEIASQHPLRDGKPGVEFVGRLEYGMRLFEALRAQGLHAEVLVTGSVHRPDTISLSAAGMAYMKERGIPEAQMHGEDLTERYKGSAASWPGVYNSADEAYVASQYFKEGNFGRLHAVAGSAQLHRKALHYLWNGVLPHMHGVPADRPHHEYLREAVDYMPFVLSVDPGHQEPDSPAAKRSREERMP